MRRKVDPDYRRPTFEENLERQYAYDITLASEAEDMLDYSRTRLAIIRRAVFYVRFNEISGQFLGLPSQFGDLPEAWGQVYLERIPQTKLGAVYRKSTAGKHVGKVVSAALVEATGMVWQYDGKLPGERKNDTKLAHRLDPALKLTATSV